MNPKLMGPGIPISLLVRGRGRPDANEHFDTQERKTKAARLTWPQPGKAQANVSFSLPSFPLPLPSAAGDPNPSSSFRVAADCLLAGISRIFYASLRVVSRRNTVRRAENERPWYGGGTRKVEVNKTGGPPLFQSGMDRLVGKRKGKSEAVDGGQQTTVRGLAWRLCR